MYTYVPRRVFRAQWKFVVKNNLRFIEMQRGEPLVILFHRHQTRMVCPCALVHPLRFSPPPPLFSLSLHSADSIQPVFFVSPFVRNSTGAMEVWKERITTESARTTRRRENQRRGVADRKRGARRRKRREQTELSQLTSHLTSAWEDKISLEVYFKLYGTSVVESRRDTVRSGILNSSILAERPSARQKLSNRLFHS